MSERMMIMRYFDSNTGILISDSSRPLLSGKADDESLRKTLSHCILSASGWRAVMAASGDEEDSTEETSEEMLLIAAAAAAAFFDYLGMERPRIVMGCDARPTGRLLSEAVRRAFIAKGAILTDIHISSAPEIMAFSHSFDGFFYISASHNPVGHNGYKFGVLGGVLPKEEMDGIIPSFRQSIEHEGAAAELRALVERAPEEEVDRVLKEHDRAKRKALSVYESFVMRTARVNEPFSLPFGVVIDFNGSARAASIDIPFLRRHDAALWAMNSEPRQIAHAIVPEGENLEYARKALEERHRKDPSFIIGYMPDNDGDRGNFVYIDRKGKARILSAQTVFALVAAIEIAHDTAEGKKRIAIAINGPTSLLIDDISARLGAKVFRSDIGEANVVTLSASLRSRGYTCRVCGEGSNGGNITYPAKVRDPLNSLMTFAKLWSVDGLYAFLMEKLGKHPEDTPSLSSLVDALPSYMTTSAFSSDAVMHIRSTDYNRLKAEYEKLLSSEIDRMMEGRFSSWEERQYEGSEESIGMGTEYRAPDSTGGLKVQFYGSDGKAEAYLWLSKSRTEPVIRTMVDIKGSDKSLHDTLLEWQHSLVERADEASRA